MADFEFDLEQPQPDVTLDGLRLHVLALVERMTGLEAQVAVLTPPPVEPDEPPTEPDAPEEPAEPAPEPEPAPPVEDPQPTPDPPEVSP